MPPPIYNGNARRLHATIPCECSRFPFFSNIARHEERKSHANSLVSLIAAAEGSLASGRADHRSKHVDSVDNHRHPNKHRVPPTKFSTNFEI